MTNKVLYSNTVEMAPSTIHLKIAYDVAEQMDINVSGQFLLGSLAPDAVFARVNYTIDDIKNTHYRQESVKKSWYLAANEFKDTDNLFLKGYCIHIMTDVLWVSSVLAQLTKQHGENFSKNTLAEDMNYVEKWLYRQKEYLSLWNGILGTKINNINYYVSPGEVDLFKSQKSQSIKYDLVADGMKYITLDDIEQFINKSVKRILIELQN